MKKKSLSLRTVLKEELKDKEFRKYYEEEGRKLSIGYKISQLRKRVGLTQRQLARKIHTTQSVVSRLENGNYWTCSIKTLKKIALATGTHLSVDFEE